jgi:hypothetical protein
MTSQTSTSPKYIADLSNVELLAMYESACAIAAQQYADKVDTSRVDAEVDALMAEMTNRGF